MTTMEWQVIELNTPDSSEWNFTIPYKWQTPQAGRAEFSVCAKWKRGRLTDLWISTAQQPDAHGKMYHVCVTTRSNGLYVSHGAAVWVFSWCKMHKCQNFNVYVPDDTDELHISMCSTVSLMFSKGKEGKGC